MIACKTNFSPSGVSLAPIPSDRQKHRKKH